MSIPTFAEIARLRLSEIGPRDKIVIIKTTRGAARMMAEREESRDRLVAKLIEQYQRDQSAGHPICPDCGIEGEYNDNHAPECDVWRILSEV